MSDASTNFSEASARAEIGPALIGRVGERIAHLGFKPINHVLLQHQWARDKLKMHSTKTVRIGIVGDATELISKLPVPRFVTERLNSYLQQAPNSVDCQIANDGTLIALPLISPEEQADLPAPTVTMRIKPSVDTLKSAITAGPSGLQSHLVIDGDVMLAAALGEIAQHARWDFEDDLSFLTGDKIARRVGDVAERVDRRAQEVLPKLMPHLTSGLDRLASVLDKLSQKIPSQKTPS